MRVSAAVSVSLLSTCSLALTLPPGDGPYGTSLAVTNLTDRSRVDPYSPDGALRNLMVSIFSPVPRHECVNTSSPYMPALSAAFFDQIYAPLTTNGTFESLFLDTCEPISRQPLLKQHQTRSDAHPLAIFSPGAGNSRLIYNALAQAISSHGYHVVTIDHPSDALGIEYLDHSYVLAANYSTDADYEAAIRVRAADVHFVLDAVSSGSGPLAALLSRSSVALSHVAVVGHSLGGATALSAMLTDRRIKAGVNLDGKFFPGVFPKGARLERRPFMLVGNEARNASTDPTWDLALSEYLRGPKVELQIQGWEHGAFTDFPTLLSSFGLGGYFEGIGDVDGPRALDILTTSLSGFFDAARKRAANAELEKALARFPEVEVVAIDGF